MKPRTDTTEFRASAYHARVQQFVRSLPAARRAEIARRPRFRNQPHLRRRNTPDREDAIR